MKRVILSISMLAGTFAFANNGNGDTKNSETKPLLYNQSRRKKLMMRLCIVGLNYQMV